MVSSGYALPFISQGAFLRLDDLASRDKVNLGMFTPVDLRGFQLHGRTYALPITSGVAWTNLMFYNKDMLAEVGLAGPPATWQEWRAAARRMTKAAGDGAVQRAGTTLPPMHVVTHWNGGALWSDDWKDAQVNNAPMRETVEFLTGLSQDVYGAYANYAPWIASHTFTNEDYALWFQNNSAFGFLKDAPFEWGVTLASQPAGIREEVVFGSAKPGSVGYWPRCCPGPEPHRVYPKLVSIGEMGPCAKSCATAWWWEAAWADQRRPWLLPSAAFPYA